MHNKPKKLAEFTGLWELNALKQKGSPLLTYLGMNVAPIHSVPGVLKTCGLTYKGETPYVVDDTCDLAGHLVDLVFGRFCNQQLDSPNSGNRAGNSNHQSRFGPTRRLDALTSTIPLHY